MTAQPQEECVSGRILQFWFEESGSAEWFAKRPAFDALVRDRFAAAHDRAMAGDYDNWEQDPRRCLALVILLDQFPRNMFRDTARAYQSDPKALGIARRAIAAGRHNGLSTDEKKFMFLPLEHSEALADQEQCLELMRGLGEERSAEAALKHLVIIQRFGRFPHRNAILGRQSTPEEVAFLEEPDSSF